MIRPFLFLLAALSLPAGAEEIAPGAFAFGTLVETSDDGPLHRVRIPATVYQHCVRGDLADLRVFNAAAQPVPYALRPARASTETQPPGVALPVFPLPEISRDDGTARLHVRIERNGTLVSLDRTPPADAATVAAYLVDASTLQSDIATLEMSFAGSDPLVARVDVEASNDLRNFRMVSASAPLLRTRMGGQTLSQMRVELGGVKAKYLRIRATAGSLGAILEQVTALPPAEAAVLPREHLVAANGKATDSGVSVSELDGAYPADRVSVDPVEDNTVLPYEIDGRLTEGGDWVRLGAGTAYRLKQGDVTIASATVPVRTGAWRAWRVRIQGNAPSSAAPRLRLEWIPAEIVFAARGAGPYMLAYGSSTIRDGGALPVDTLVPGYGTSNAVEPTIATTGKNVMLAGPEALQPAANLRQWGLWGVMAAGALFIGMMAARLLRQGGSRASGGGK